MLPEMMEHGSCIYNVDLRPFPANYEQGARKDVNERQEFVWLNTARNRHTDQNADNLEHDILISEDMADTARKETNVMRLGAQGFLSFSLLLFALDQKIWYLDLQELVRVLLSLYRENSECKSKKHEAFEKQPVFAIEKQELHYSRAVVNHQLVTASKWSEHISVLKTASYS